MVLFKMSFIWNKVMSFYYQKANSGKVKCIFKDLLQIRFWSLSFSVMNTMKHSEFFSRKTFSQSQLFWGILTRSSNNCNQKLIWAFFFFKIPWDTPVKGVLNSDTFGNVGSIKLTCKRVLWISRKGYSLQSFLKAYD